MARSLPASPKVYTTKYANFKGVDFTNDPTNVWYRRSPTGTNMLPDASGRPFKRNGWSVLLSNADISAVFGKESCTIFKCSYFEIAGVDHIVVFTDEGVLFYNEDGIADFSTDYDCYTGYDRSFFFEGDGIAAFYIYGNFKVWRYESDFQLHNVTDKITIPTLLIGTSADGTGTFYEGYNLLGTKAAIEYGDCSLFTYWGSDGLSFTVPDTFKDLVTINDKPMYRYTWNGASWDDTNITGVSFASTGITVNSTPNEDDEIIIIYIYGVMLPTNVSQSQVDEIKVNVSKSMQYDFPLVVQNNTYTPLTASDCALWDDDTLHRTDRRAWIQFDHAWTGVDGEDFIRVEFPSVNINVTEYPIAGHETDCQDIGTASLVGV